MNQKTLCPLIPPDYCVLGDNTLQWEYECEMCQSHFQVAVPKGPSQEKEIACPTCKSRHLKRIKAPLLESACAG